MLIEVSFTHFQYEFITLPPCVPLDTHIREGFAESVPRFCRQRWHPLELRSSSHPVFTLDDVPEPIECADYAENLAIPLGRLDPKNTAANWRLPGQEPRNADRGWGHHYPDTRRGSANGPAPVDYT